jgi:peptide deformylase
LKVCYETLMSILKVARIGHPILRKVAQELSAEDIAKPETQRLIDDMIETMKEYDGVGLAAVQVHISRQIAVLEVTDNPRYPHKEKVPLAVLINPKIETLTDEMEEDWEGCLSINELRGQVPRYKNIRVVGLDRDGKEFNLVASGFHARVIQHEWDHLQGKVYLDRMKDLSTLTYLTELARYWTDP